MKSYKCLHTSYLVELYRLLSLLLLSGDNSYSFQWNLTTHWGHYWYLWSVSFGYVVFYSLVPERIECNLTLAWLVIFKLTSMTDILSISCETIQTNAKHAKILSIGPSGINLNKNALKKLSAKRQAFGLRLNVLSHWDLVMPYGEKDLGQHWPREWLGATKPLPNQCGLIINEVLGHSSESDFTNAHEIDP